MTRYFGRSRSRRFESLTPRLSAIQAESLPVRLVLSPVLGPLAINGTSGPDTILVSPEGVSRTDVMVTLNGVQTGPYRPTGAIRIQGLEGNDTITISSGVTLPTEIDGGQGNDQLNGGSGDDTFLTRDHLEDVITGGHGRDTAATDSHDRFEDIEIQNPLQVAATNATQTVRVMVVNYEPRVPSQGGKKLWEVFGWNDPRFLATTLAGDLEMVSGGAVDIEITEWRNLDKFPAFEDGFRYDADQYVVNRQTNTGWHTGQIDFPRMVDEEGIAAIIDSGIADEVWFYGDHYFIPVIGESWMAGPNAFGINGPVYPDIPVSRAFASMGFNYERGPDAQLHDIGHRTEATMNRIYGGWNLAAPVSNWDRFSANAAQSNGLAGVGTTHYPANAEEDYDTDNPRIVQSWADDYLNYPNLTGYTESVSRDTWSNGATPDYEYDYQRWYFSHIPRAAGVNSDGRQNNWWKYIYDFNNYSASGDPLPNSALLLASPLLYAGGSTWEFEVAYSGAVPIDITSVGTGDVKVSGPAGFVQTAQVVRISDSENDTHVVARYRITAPGGSWNVNDIGVYSIELLPNEVRNVLGTSIVANGLGSFRYGDESGLPLASTAQTELLLSFDGSTTGAAGEIPSGSSALTWVGGRIGQGVYTGASGSLRYPSSGNINSLAGTVEFWVKPNWNSSTGMDRRFLVAGANFNNGMLLGIDGAQNLRFIQWGDDPTTPTVESDVERGVATSAADWTANVWHHVAATWDSTQQQMILYVDGRIADSSHSVVRIPAFSGTEMSVGSSIDGPGKADAVFDEFHIMRVAAPGGEILNDFRRAQAFQSIQVRGSSTSMFVGETQVLHAVGITADGSEVDVTQAVRWSSAAPNRVSAGANGYVLARAAGSTSISVQLGTLTASRTLAVTDSTGPIPSFSVGDVVAAGGTELVISVTYSDAQGVRAQSLGLGDLEVRGPNGFLQFPVLVGSGSGPGAVTATYRLEPPGGQWDASDNGLYRVTSRHGQVEDTSGNRSGMEVADEFNVQVAPLLLGPVSPSAVVSPRIHWQPVPDASYDIWIDNLTTGQTQAFRQTVTQNYFDPSGLGVGSWRAWVRSLHRNGTVSAWSTVLNFRNEPPVVPNTPTRQQNTSRPTFSWAALPGAATYEVWINNLSTAQSGFIRQTQISITSWTAAVDVPLGKYRAWIRGVDAAGTPARWSVAVDFDVVTAPSGLTPINATFVRRPVLSWAPTPGATRYDVYVRSLTTGQVVHYPRGLTATSWTPSSNLTDGPYRWWVQASSAQNVMSFWSLPVDLHVGGRTSLTGPAGTIAQQTPLFAWLAVQGAQTYELWVESVATAVRVIHQTTLTGTTFQATAPLAVGAYRAWVRAISSTGEKAVWSNVMNFTIASAESTGVPHSNQLGASRDIESLVLFDAHALSAFQVERGIVRRQMDDPRFSALYDSERSLIARPIEAPEDGQTPYPDAGPEPYQENPQAPKVHDKTKTPIYPIPSRAIPGQTEIPEPLLDQIVIFDFC